MTFTSRISLVLLSFALALVLLPAAGQAQVGGGGNTCVFVFGTINGQTVTTPAIMVVVPPTNVVLGPTRIHVDPVSETFLGFTLTVPGADQTVNGATLFVPGADPTAPSFTAALNDLNLSQNTCVNFGITIPAVEIDVPASVLALPGAVVDTPEITINALGVQQTVDGQVITVSCQAIVVPSIHDVQPSMTVGTPNQTIAVNLNNVLATAEVLDTTQPSDLHDVVPPPSGDPNEPSPGCQAQ